MCVLSVEVFRILNHRRAQEIRDYDDVCVIETPRHAWLRTMQVLLQCGIKGLPGCRGMNVDQVTNAGVKAFPNTSNEVVTLGLTWNLNYTKSVIKSPLHPQRNGSIVCAITHDNQSKYKRTPALFSACSCSTYFVLVAIIFYILLLYSSFFLSWLSGIGK